MIYQSILLLLGLFIHTSLFAQDNPLRVLVANKIWEGNTSSVTFEVVEGGKTQSLSTKGQYRARATDELNDQFMSLKEAKEKYFQKYCGKPYKADLFLAGESIHEDDVTLGAARWLPIREGYEVKGPTTVRIGYMEKGSTNLETTTLSCGVQR